MSPAGPAAQPRLHRLLDAVLSIGSELDLQLVLQRIVEVAAELVEARYGALGVLDESGERLGDFITTGIDNRARERIGHLPEGHGILGLLIIEPHPRRLQRLSSDPASTGFPPGHPEMTSFLGAPIQVRERAFGNLYLCDKTDGRPFTEEDEELIVALGAAAGVAIENARLHAQVADLALADERDRIARDLHDTVIQRLFATGLGLQAIARRIDDRDLEQRLAESVDDLDATIRQIRSTIFELQTSTVAGTGLHRSLVSLVAEASRPLGFRPAVDVDGPLDTLAGEQIGGHLLAVAREALANVARHAKASRVRVLVRCGEERLRLEVIDDGVGPASPDPSGRGLENITARAGHLGGTASIESVAPHGTRVVWEVPLAGTARAGRPR
ncbi:MAG: GAF domain-containing sensor histidine kinase [Actinobacteria bacterium]|nr:GAF domain-containing sensor histidine kinase [Actinomycetota bacterium]